MNLVVRPQFYLDIEEEVAWLAEHASAEVARRWYEALWCTIDFLKLNPEVGRLRQDLKRPNIRSWRMEDFGRWLIFYGIRKPDLVIYRVRSGTMNLMILRMES